jgi:hypothetical protein
MGNLYSLYNHRAWARMKNSITFSFLRQFIWNSSIYDFIFSLFQQNHDRNSITIQLSKKSRKTSYNNYPCFVITASNLIKSTLWVQNQFKYHTNNIVMAKPRQTLETKCLNWCMFTFYTSLNQIYLTNISGSVGTLKAYFYYWLYYTDLYW